MFVPTLRIIRCPHCHRRTWDGFACRECGTALNCRFCVPPVFPNAGIVFRFIDLEKDAQDRFHSTRNDKTDLGPASESEGGA